VATRLAYEHLGRAVPGSLLGAGAPEDAQERLL